MTTVAMIGAGSWGTALALQLCRNGHHVRLWGHDPGLVADLVRERENTAFLPGFPLPDTLEPVSDLAAAVASVQAVLIAVPSQFFARVIADLLPLLPERMGLSWATKGFDPEHGRLLHEVIHQQAPERELGVLSGPSFAGEVARGLPTAVTVAATSEPFARQLADLFHGERFRAYRHDDLIGVQVGGAAKNVLAIATGIADGLGFGANTRSALITRGLTELIRLGVALGARRETFMGLAGLGDLVLTCTDNQSRNRRLGLALAAGQPLSQAIAQIGQEVEGVITAMAVHKLALAHRVDMPICQQVHAVLYQGRTPQEAAARLLERAVRPELDSDQ
jgi:glycerol-3-phosphate dehydrogenase (NAD(P)+)